MDINFVNFAPFCQPYCSNTNFTPFLASIIWGLRKFVHFLNVWFQKISILPPQRELEIPMGVGGSKSQEIPEERGPGQLI